MAVVPGCLAITWMQTFAQVCLAAHSLLRVVSEALPIAYGCQESGCRAAAASAVAQHWIDRPVMRRLDPSERQAACFWRKLL
jgi:hypothetical protein